MKKYRLTESRLRGMIREAVNEALNEGYAQQQNYVNDNIYRKVQEIAKSCQQYLQSKNETALGPLYWQCAEFTQALQNAQSNAQNVYGNQ